MQLEVGVIYRMIELRDLCGQTLLVTVILFYLISESPGNGITENNGGGDFQCRCVRFGEGETSEGSSGSSDFSGSGSSILGSEQPITMIGPMYLAEDFPEFIHINTNDTEGNYYYGGWTLTYHNALRFCKELNYNGYNDWSLPSLYQILDFVTNNSNYIGIPNFSSLGTINGGYNALKFWTLTDGGDDGVHPYEKIMVSIYNNNYTLQNWDGSTIGVENTYSGYTDETVGNSHFCFCVR